MKHFVSASLILLWQLTVLLCKSRNLELKYANSVDKEHRVCSLLRSSHFSHITVLASEVAVGTCGVPLSFCCSVHWKQPWILEKWLIWSRCHLVSIGGTVACSRITCEILLVLAVKYHTDVTWWLFGIRMKSTGLIYGLQNVDDWRQCYVKLWQLIHNDILLYFLSAHTHTHTTVLQLCGICPRQPGWAGTRRNIHPLTHIMVISHPLSASSIYYDPRKPTCSNYMPDNLFPQTVSKFSLVYLFIWHPPLHTPYISSRNHCLPSTTHAHTITTCFAVLPRLCHLILVSLSTLYLELYLVT